jgi:hypothetical protein
VAEQSQDDLRTHLNEQLGSLKADAEAFDRGNRPQAKRLALGVRVLLHDTDRSRSLLGLLRHKDRLFIDTASPRPDRESRTSYAGLVGTTFFVGPSEFIPHRNEVRVRPVPFEDWWNATIIADVQQGTISRRDLISTRSQIEQRPARSYNGATSSVARIHARTFARWLEL